MLVPDNKAQWDEHRNTSRVFGVPEGAHKQAVTVLRAWAAANPQHAAWIAAGAPPIHSEQEHQRWFGCAYKRGHR